MSSSPITRPKRSLSSAALAGVIAMSALFGSGATYFLLRPSAESGGSAPALTGANAIKGNSTAPCDRSLVRLKGFNLVHPLLYSETECPAASLSGLNGQLAAYIDQQKSNGVLKEASVYVRLLNTAEWTDVNESASFYPGSLFKLPLLFAVLKTAEKQPGFLDKKINFPAGGAKNITQTFESQSVSPGHTYSVRQLLESMITNSDNYASQLLMSSINPNQLMQVFRDLGLQAPPMDASYFNYQISAKDFSRFMVTLYNGTYLSQSQSEYAAELLTKSTFNLGITHGLPPNVRVAHKFGEAGHGAEMQLHESAIVFVDNKPYVITIMTSGSNLQQLTTTVSDLSKLVFDALNRPAV
ncbi:MAG: serine hydrolase [Chitinophagia bacterium]|nr:serine hydrolase [Chitinophagia bacterium]